MAIQVLHILTFVSLFFFATDAATIFVKNNCRETIWPATLTSGKGQPQLSTTGFRLAPGASKSIHVPAPWTGRIWARTHCSIDRSSRFTCRTGDCASGSLSCKGAGGIPPATLAEFTLAPNGGLDFYDVSLVDGFNVPASIVARGGKGACQSSSCKANVNKVCPKGLQLTATDGKVIACKSACLAFNRPQYCCTGEFNDPKKCRPTHYSLIFEKQCPQAYSYAYDDKSSTFTCSGAPNYVVTFCP